MTHDAPGISVLFARGMPHLRYFVIMIIFDLVIANRIGHPLLRDDLFGQASTHDGVVESGVYTVVTEKHPQLPKRMVGDHTVWRVEGWSADMYTFAFKAGNNNVLSFRGVHIAAGPVVLASVKYSIYSGTKLALASLIKSLITLSS